MATKGDISDLDILMFGGKPIVPRTGASRKRVSGIVQSDVAGGLTRQRKKYFNQPYQMDATFHLGTPFLQDYLKIFFERNEGKRFICYLSADRPITEPYVVQVISEWTDSDITYKYATLTVTLEVYPARDTNLDEFLNFMYPVVGNDLSDWISDFNKMVEAAPDV